MGRGDHILTGLPFGRSPAPSRATYREENDMELTGRPAPDFTLPRDGGGEVALSAADGPVVLFFYPRADTPGCTKEALAFTDMAEQFAAHGTTVLAVSRDPVRTQEKFRDKHGLKIALLSDTEGDVCERYGVWVEKTMYGKTSMGIERSTFLIDPEGVVRAEWRKVKVDGHAEAVLKTVREAFPGEPTAAAKPQ
jgi:thioredoxin-dependent peroxiredoxin